MTVTMSGTCPACDTKSIVKLTNPAIMPFTIDAFPCPICGEKLVLFRKGSAPKPAKRKPWKAEKCPYCGNPKPATTKHPPACPFFNRMWPR